MASWKSQHRNLNIIIDIEKILNIMFNFCKLLWKFSQTFYRKICGVFLLKYTCRPSWNFSIKLFRAGILQKCARLEAVVFGMQFTNKKLHCRLQTWHLRNLVGVSILVTLQTVDFLKFPKKFQFSTEFYNVEISPITLRKIDSSR